jgi:plasmid stabilization system protein ParE
MHRIITSPNAIQDIQSALHWYDAIQEQLRRKLADELDRHFTRLSEAPRQFPVAFRDVRRAVVSRFPYSIYFFIEPGTVVVIAVMHNRRDPSLWQSRL